MKIAILGGSFDPPHVEHLWIARQVREIEKIDQVWLMPTFAHPWRKHYASTSQRLSMVKLMEEEGVIASSVEIDKQFHYTIQTVRFLKDNYNDDFEFIIGSDLMINFHQWKDHQKLLQFCQILVFPRIDFSASNLPKNVKEVRANDLVKSSLSSTVIRSRLKLGLSVSGMVTPEVSQFIKENSLYL